MDELLHILTDHPGWRAEVEVRDGVLRFKLYVLNGKSWLHIDRCVSLRGAALAKFDAVALELREMETALAAAEAVA